MCAYNKINGIHCSENYYLTNTLLRKKWKFDGLVMTDWGATKDRVAGIKSGIDLDMPGGCKYNKKQIKKAIKNNTLTEKELDFAVKNVLNLVFSFEENKIHSKEELNVLFKKHNKIALELAIDSAVLLKNENTVLLPGLSSGFFPVRLEHHKHLPVDMVMDIWCRQQGFD